MSLNDIPTEILHYHLAPLLDVPDLARLRQVSKTLYQKVSDPMAKIHEKLQKMVLNEGTFKELLDTYQSVQRNQPINEWNKDYFQDNLHIDITKVNLHTLLNVPINENVFVVYVANNTVNVKPFSNITIDDLFQFILSVYKISKNTIFRLTVKNNTLTIFVDEVGKPILNKIVQDVPREVVDKLVAAHLENDLLVSAVRKNNVNLVKYLIEECHANLAYRSYAAPIAALELNNVYLLSYFIEQCGLNIHFNNNYMYRNGANGKNPDVVAYLNSL